MPVDLLALFTKGIWVSPRARSIQEIIMPIDVLATTQEFTVDVATVADVFDVDVEFIED